MAAEDVTAVRTVPLFARRDGGPHLPPVLMLHGLGETSASWEHVTERLARNHHVVAVDLRGHGQSPWPGEYDFASMRDDVLAFIDESRWSRLALVGHSLGGVVAFMVAVAVPERIEWLVVEDATPPRPRPLRPVPERPSHELPFDWSAAVVMRRQVTDGLPELWAELGRIQAPTLLVGGGPSSPLDQDDIAEAARLIPDAEVVTIDVGHDVHENAPGAFVDAVEAWRSRIS